MPSTLICMTIETPLCPMRAATTDRGICLLEMGSPQRRSRETQELETAYGCAMRTGSHPLLDQLAGELAAYFSGDLQHFSVPLDTPGTEWQQRVWAELVRIPFGQTTSYGELANRMGNPGGSRAVGLANGRNRVSIVIPCHRVIASDGTLHGYGGGIERKRWLLEHEQLQSGAALFAQ
jgi:AraC family transcriptional regulator of adaptative response/methylated-DNA-[protein]-cysteine methyltransferase